MIPRKFIFFLSLIFHVCSAFANSDLWTFPYAENSTDKRVGWYPGSFDPPTKGHFTVIKTSIEALKLDTIYITVNGMTNKEYKSSIDKRVRMVQAMLEGKFPNVNVIVSVEPIQGKRSLIQKFIERHGKGNVHAIFGTDTIQLNWARMGDIKGFHYVLNLRAAYDIEIEGIDKSRIEYINSGSAVNSSSQARKDILEKGTSDILGPNVESLVEEYHLYSTITLSEKDYYIAKKNFFGQRIKRKFPDVRLPKEPLIPLEQQTEAAYDDLIIRQILRNNDFNYQKQKQIYRFFQSLLEPKQLTIFRIQYLRNLQVKHYQKFNKCFAKLHRLRDSVKAPRRHKPTGFDVKHKIRIKY